jgi:hypothetical protein
MSRSMMAAVSAAVLAMALAAPAARADRVVRGTTHTSVNGNVNVNRNVNVDRDLDVDVDRDYHPVATAAAVGTAAVVTAAAVGTVVHNLPQACAAVQVGNISYQQCGSTWYQPQYAGTQLTYVVVNPPR